MKSNRKLIMNLHGIQGNPEKPQQKGNGKTSNEGILPPPVVKTVVSSSQSLISSTGIGEFGMNIAVAFSMAVKDHLFPKLKFLKGTNVSLDFSMDATSICGFLQINCGVSKADAYQWWK
jgi:hypothetical protein